MRCSGENCFDEIYHNIGDKVDNTEVLEWSVSKLNSVRKEYIMKKKKKEKLELVLLPPKEYKKPTKEEIVNACVKLILLLAD